MPSLPSRLLFTFALSALAFLAAAAERLPARPRPLQADPVGARVIVKFKPGAGTVREHALGARSDAAGVANTLARRASALGARHGLALAAGRAITERMQVVTAHGIDGPTLARTLAADPDVEYAEVDRRRRHLAVPNDPLYEPVAGTSPASGQWYLKTPTASAARNTSDIVSGIDAPSAWDATTGSSSVVVAVLDSGVRFDHPDLAGRLLAGYDMVGDAALSNDGDGRDGDASDPGDYVTPADTRTPTFSGCEVADSAWHGTMVSGLIGAAGNDGLGMTGVAWNVSILPVRVLGKCFGHDSDIVAGMRWAAGLPVPGVPAAPQRARVINLSLGSDGACPSSYADAVSEVTAAGALVVAAAGNSTGHAVTTPANCPGVVGVGGLRHIGTKVGFSDVGGALAISAPAGNCVNLVGPCLYPILTTTNLGTTTPIAGSAGAAYTDSLQPSLGTSFSAPLVAGAAALMLAIEPRLAPSRLAELLKGSARPFPTTGAEAGVPVCHAPDGTDQLECYCTTSTCGAGMLDAAAAVRAAQAVGADASLQARIGITPVIPGPGETVTLSGADTQFDTGRSIVAWAWALVDGGGVVAGFAGGRNQPSVTAVPSAAGRFTVRLTVTDDRGLQSSTDTTVMVDGLRARIAVSPSAPAPGGTVTLSASGTVLDTGRSVVSYGWSLLESNGIVSGFSGPADGASATIVPTAAGSFTVRLTVTDDLGKQSTADATVTVAATPAGSTSTGSSGGGAMSPLALLALGIAAALLRRRASS